MRPNRRIRKVINIIKEIERGKVREKVREKERELSPSPQKPEHKPTPKTQPNPLKEVKTPHPIVRIVATGTIRIHGKVYTIYELEQAHTINGIQKKENAFYFEEKRKIDNRREKKIGESYGTKRDEIIAIDKRD